MKVYSKTSHMYLLDTNIISLNFRGNQVVVNHLKEKSGDELFLCTISLAESYYGCKNSKNLSLKNQLMDYYDYISSTLTLLDFDLPSARIYAKLKSRIKQTGKIIEDFDLAITAICLSGSLTLVTNNTKDFENILLLRVEDWTI